MMEKYGERLNLKALEAGCHRAFANNGMHNAFRTRI
jgi:hypothetical protein